jgi:RNA polymerase-binding transcription factor DksA
MPTSNPGANLQSIKQELERERDKIKIILQKRAHKDPQSPNNFVTDFLNTGSEVDDDVFEDEEYEVNLAIEHVLEKRLKQIKADLAKIAAGTYQI